MYNLNAPSKDNGCGIVLVASARYEDGGGSKDCQASVHLATRNIVLESLTIEGIVKAASL